MRFAYADPPYIGQAKKHYGKEATFAGEVDYPKLFASLATYDGWAMSASSPSLRVLLSMAPPDVRIAAWVKPFAIFKPNVNPAYAWEPVIFRGARKRDRSAPTVRDWVSCNITLKKGLCGAKPEKFCVWLFELLGLEPDDVLDDLFPGTGIVTETWLQWRERGAAA